MDIQFGAKIVANFRDNNICTKEEAERLLAFTNNSGPLFIVGTVGICFFNNSLIGILLLITHLMACISVGFIFKFWKRKKNSDVFINKNTFLNNNYNSNTSNIGEILGKSISSATNTVVLIGGFIILFSVIISVLKNSNILLILSIIIKPVLHIFNINSNFGIPFISGIIELTTGCNMITNITTKSLSHNIIISAFLIGFGGISVLLQVFGIVSKSKISIKPYIYGKILQAVFAAFYTYIAISYFPVFNFDL